LAPMISTFFLSAIRFPRATRPREAKVIQLGAVRHNLKERTLYCIWVLASDYASSSSI
jgi:hypothetical protein